MQIRTELSSVPNQTMRDRAPQSPTQQNIAPRGITVDWLAQPCRARMSSEPYPTGPHKTVQCLATPKSTLPDDVFRTKLHQTMERQASHRAGSPHATEQWLARPSAALRRLATAHDCRPYPTVQRPAKPRVTPPDVTVSTHIIGFRELFPQEILGKLPCRSDNTVMEPSEEAKMVLAALNQISVIRPMPEQRLEVIDKAIAELIRDKERLNALEEILESSGSVIHGGDITIHSACGRCSWQGDTLREAADRAVEEQGR